MACFDAYRMTSGAMRPEAFEVRSIIAAGTLQNEFRTKVAPRNTKEAASLDFRKPG